MDLEKLNKALAIWQGPASINSDNYHDSKGYMSNSFVGEFLKCEYNAVLNYALGKDHEEFKKHLAIGQTVEHIIFNGENDLHEYLENKFGSDGMAPVTKSAQNLFNDIVLSHKYNESKKMNDVEFELPNGKKPTKTQRDRMDKIVKDYPEIPEPPEPQPRAWVEEAQELAKQVTKHEDLIRILRSEGSVYHQVLTFEMYGLLWKVEVDYLNRNKETEIDLKTNRDFDRMEYNEDTRQKDLTFIDVHDYFRQRAIYREAIKRVLKFDPTSRILAINKATKSVRMFKFDDVERLDHEIKTLEPIATRIKEVINGEEIPRQCGVCPNCVESESVMTEILVSSFCAPWR